MNGKRAKALRREAEGMTVGLPQRRLMVRQRKINGINTPEMIVHHECTRAMYQHLKAKSRG
jgi:hypothetical protein